MERQSSHRVDIINSRDSLNIYSTLENDGNIILQSKTYNSLHDAKEDLELDVNLGEKFYDAAKIYSYITGAATLTASLWLLKDSLNLPLFQVGTNPEIDLIPLCVGAGVYAISKLIQSRALNNLKISNHEFTAVKEAEVVNQIQFQKVFPHPEDNI